MSSHEQPLPWEDDELIWKPVLETLGDTFDAYKKLQASNGPTGLFPGTILRVIKSKSVPRNAKATLLPWRKENAAQKRLIAEVSVTDKKGRSQTYKLFKGDLWDILEYSVHDQHRTYYDRNVDPACPD